MRSTPARDDVSPVAKLPSSRLLDVVDLSVAFPVAGAQGGATVQVNDHAAWSVVVDGVSFSIGRGERYALVGESGSGKSITAQTLMRLHPRTRIGGTVRFEGADLITADEAQLRRVRGREIAMIFQEPMAALNPLYSIGEQISEVLVVHRALARSQARRRAIELLERCGSRSRNAATTAFRTSYPAGSASAR